MPAGRHRLYSSAPSSSFTYRLAAASVAKQTPAKVPRVGRDVWNYASADTSAIPYLKSTKQVAGEDAFFATTIGGSSHDVAFGLADGVGGWKDQGIDPSRFSHGLCEVMLQTAHSSKNAHTLRPRDLLQVAYDAVSQDSSIDAGGSTASLAIADGEGNMEAAK